MRKEILIALIGAFTTIAAPIVTIAASEYVKNMDYKEIGDDKTRSAIEGRWAGVIKQVLFDEPVSIPIEFDFKPSGKTVVGDAVILYDGKTIPLSVEGHFPVERFLTLNYRNKNDIKLHFGSIAAGFNANADKIVGRYVGYGHINDSLIDGVIELSKQVR